jgi:ribose transport system permease protein
LFGGRGRVVNSVVAYLFLAMLGNGLIMFGVEPVFHQVIVGVILVAVVAADTQLNKEAG